MENQETYNPSYLKFDSYFEYIVHRLAKLKPDLFRHIDLEDFEMFFEEPSLKGKNKGLPRNYSIFNNYLTSSQGKFSDENYVEDVCFALTCRKINCINGLDKTPCEIMVNRYQESARYKEDIIDYEVLKNELYIDDVTSSLIASDTEDILFHRVFERGYLNKYFNGSDTAMLKDYLKFQIRTNGETNIKDFTNHYQDSRSLSAKAYDTRLRNIYKAWVAFSVVKFDLWDDLKGFEYNPFKSLQGCVDFLNSLKPWKERQQYSKQKRKKEVETSTPKDQELRYKVLKEYLIGKFGGSNVREVDGAFEVLVGKKWCLKYFLNGGYNNLKTGEKGSWINSLNISN